MNEFELIERLKPLLPGNAATVAGAGDDCAVLDLGVPGRFVLFKTDAMVEGVHFTAETPPEKVGRKALARCLSDIAAMAGQPVSALVTLGLPKGFDPARVEAIYGGMAELASSEGVSISGGETTTNQGTLFLGISMVGTVAKDRCILRSGAKEGDAIFVTGELGGSLEGRHLEFEPRLAEARWLAENHEIHAMMDVSDGLAGDLHHILRASGVGAELLTSAIPISRAALLQSRAESSAKPPLLAALTDGEDFELVFTLPPGQAVLLLDGWRQRFPQIKLSCIGRIQAAFGLRLRDHRGVRSMELHGYTHHQQS